MAVIVIVLESIVAAIVVPSTDFTLQYDPNNPNPQRGVPVYLTIFICAQIFQIVLCWDAVWHQNTIQMIGFVLFNLAVFCYAIFQYVQLRNPTMTGTSADISSSNLSILRGALIAIPVVLGIGLTAFTYLAYKLYLEFGWKIYKKIGADPKMRSKL